MNRVRRGWEVDAAAVLTLALCLLSVCALPATAVGQDGRARAAVDTRISQASAFDAPKGGKGGISNPVVWCSDYSEPTTTWTLTNVDTGWSRTWSWRGSLPNYHFPRVPVGHYRSEASGSCRGVEKSRSQKLIVEEKTAAGTVSRGEWNRIRRGMTRDAVAGIIGSNGRDPYRYAGKVSVTYDLMGFWQWSVIEYRAGRVSKKYWNVGHD